MPVKKAIILTPFWDSRQYHPHVRRLYQWQQQLEKLGFETCTVSLSSHNTPIRWVSGGIITGFHPRFVGYQKKLLLPKSNEITFEIRERLSQVVLELLEHQTIHLMIALHPLIADLTDGRLPLEKTVIDVMDIPCTSKVYPNFLCERLRGRWISVLSIYDKNTLASLCPEIREIFVIPPLIQKMCNPEHRAIPTIVLLGRSSTTAFQEVMDAVNKYIPHLQARELPIGTLVCGEVSRSLSFSKSIFPLGTLSDLKKVLSGNICFLPPPQNFTGVSYRVLDAVEAGAFLIAGNRAARGYGLKPEKHYLFAETGEQIVNAIFNILNKPKEATQRVRHAQETLFSLSEHGCQNIRSLVCQKIDIS